MMNNKQSTIEPSVGNIQIDANHTVSKGFSMPSVLHFIETEWSRYEIEKAQWEIERTDYKAKLAFLKGERDGQINFKNDLIRRIKMLELTIRHERMKYMLSLEACKNNKENDNDLPEEIKTEQDILVEKVNNQPPIPKKTESFNHNVWNINTGIESSDHDDLEIITKGCELLKTYISETGLTDSLIQERKEKIKKIYPKYEIDSHSASYASPIISFPKQYNESKTELYNETTDLVDSEVPVASISLKNVVSYASKINANMEDCNDDEDIKIIDNESNSSPKTDYEKTDKSQCLENQLYDYITTENVNYEDKSPSEDKVTENSENYSPTDIDMFADIEYMSDSLETCNNSSNVKNFHYLDAKKSGTDLVDSKSEKEGDAFSEALQLCFRNSKLSSLRGHIDVVRSIDHHPILPYLLSGSDDASIKLWNSDKDQTIACFRSHNGPVTFVSFVPSGMGNYFVSGGYDGAIKLWNIDKYVKNCISEMDYKLECQTLNVHADIVWEIIFHSFNTCFCSLDALGDLFITNCTTDTESPLVFNFETSKVKCCPSTDSKVTSIHYFNETLIAGCSNGSLIVMIENNESLFNSNDGSLSKIVKICSSQSKNKPLIMAGHDSGEVTIYSFIDNSLSFENKIQCHPEFITSLLFVPEYKIFISSSNDGFIRIWDTMLYGCIKELFGNLQKCEEGTTDLTFYKPKMILCASGADTHVNLFKFDINQLKN
ncbi:hypothetical protein A3Q56_05255 [Intoshia linei]|uniref:Striatin N-terminal domain-containing protein n=1 Tax=Intoshia linei TaxID=1819745 RepID=A0A177AYD9_9BILA|nr:hypothetical protein A3Q56_05255 [Intoshia linei]